jgi:hypothetical protein
MAEDDQVVAIMMDYVPGKRLDEAWDTLDSNQKLAIAGQLHPYINQLRDLKEDYIGAVNLEARLSLDGLIPFRAVHLVLGSSSMTSSLGSCHVRTGFTTALC